MKSHRQIVRFEKILSCGLSPTHAYPVDHFGSQNVKMYANELTPKMAEMLKVHVYYAFCLIFWQVLSLRLKSALTEAKGGKSLDDSCSLCVRNVRLTSAPVGFCFMQGVYKAKQVRSEPCIKYCSKPASKHP